MYAYLRNFISDVHISSWILQIRQILDGCGLTYFWLTQKCDNLSWNWVLNKDRDLYVEFNQEYKIGMKTKITDRLFLKSPWSLENKRAYQRLCNLRKVLFKLDILKDVLLLISAKCYCFVISVLCILFAFYTMQLWTWVNNIWIWEFSHLCS